MNPSFQISGGSVAEPFLFKPNGTLIDAMRAADQPGIINLAAGVPSPDILPGDLLRQAVEAAYQADGNKLWAYHHPEGDRELRALLAGVLGQRGIEGLSADDVVCLTGCSQGLSLAIDLLLEPGDVVACETPTYYALLEMLSARGVRLLPLPVHPHGGLDLEQTRAALDEHPPKALFTCSSLANPTGATIPLEHREPLVEMCRSRGIVIVEDDIYATLRTAGPLPPLRSFDDGRTVLYTSSFSKSVSPGLRLGYAVPGNLHEQFATAKCRTDMHSSPLTEAIMREFLKADRLEPHLDQVRTRFCQLTAQVVQVISGTFPPGTRIGPADGNYMLWVEIPRPLNLAEAARRAFTENIIFCAGRIFYPWEPRNAAMRLNCAKAAPADLLAGVKRLGQILTELEAGSDPGDDTLPTQKPLHGGL
jgi:DNA-binding transcriptional MocR family regulator